MALILADNTMTASGTPQCHYKMPVISLQAENKNWENLAS